MSEEIKVTWEEVGTATDASRTLLMIANSHPANIGMGALIMATSVAAREMNIPMENVAEMFGRTLAEVYAFAERATPGHTVN